LTTRSVHRYGDGSSQVAELFLPPGPGPFPVAVVVHGGYWKARYDRSLMTDVCLDLAQHGLAAWNIEYRRMGADGGWPHTFLDVAAATDALADLDAPLDLDRVVAVGHSAGGHLAFWLAARPMLPPWSPGASPRVPILAAVSQAGVLDLHLAATLEPSDEPTRELLGDPRAHPEVYELASPRALLPLRIPQLVLHGDRDEVVSMRIAEAYTQAAEEAGDSCELVVLDETDHMGHVDPATDAWRVARDWLVRYASAPRS
jgi:acetyl esterase/lipase